jgi:hypothetical protein
MSISSINYSSSVLGAQIRNINQQLTDLSTQLSTGKLSQNYAGMGTNEGFAIAGRAQLSNIAAYTDTITNVNVSINLANTALQSLTKIRSTVQTGSANTAQDLNVNGQTIAQNTAAAQFGSMVGVLNTQTGNRYLFSGTAVNTQSVTDAGDIINGTTTQAGFKTVMAERQAADLGANGMGRLVQTQPTPSSIQVSEDVAGSPFGLKLKAVSSTLTGATVTGPSGSPVSFSVDLNGNNPNNGDKLSIQFTLPDGTTEQIDLTASSATPTPLGSFAIDASTPVNPTNTATNLNAALNTAITKLARNSACQHLAGRGIRDRRRRQFLQYRQLCDRHAGQQPDGDSGARHRRYGAIRGDPLGFDLAGLRRRRHHHRQRHHADLRGLGRDRQPAQRHRQHPDPARQDRHHHGDVEALNGPWRLDHDQHRRCGEPQHHQLQHRRAGLARIRRDARDRHAAAAAGRLLAGELGDDAGQRYGQHREMVSGQ